MNIHIVIKRECEDYHGCSDEIVAVYKNREDAINKVKVLDNDNYNYNTDYHYESYVVN